MFEHNSHDPLYRTPAGPVPAGATVTIRFRTNEAEVVLLRTWNGEERFYPMTKGPDELWSVEITLPEEHGLFWYDFVAYNHTGYRIIYSAPLDKLGGKGQICHDGEPLESYQITIYQPNYHTPAFMHGATIYQIFPDRFRKAPTESVDDRTDRPMHKTWDDPVLYEKDSPDGKYRALDCYGGTINGIREKLPYLKELGISVLYLNPVFKARSNHRYDTGDYTQVDPLLGTNEEMKALFDEAKEAGISVMLDGVFSHTGDDSLYFNRYGNYKTKGAYQGEGSEFFNWYSFNVFPDEYRCWWGFTSLPECRKDNPDYQNYMFKDNTGIVPRWIHEGASGWRLDVADELSMDFLRKLRKAAKKAKRDAVVLGEVWEDASNKVAYGQMRCYCAGDTLDSVMNYPLREAILNFMTGKGTAHDLARLVKHQAEVYPPQFLYSLMNLMGSHDRARVLNVLVGKDGQGMDRAEQSRLELTPEEYALATARYRKCIDLLCAIPGCPTVYYGDEVGMTGCTDPFCRRTYPWGKEDTELQDYVREHLTHHRSTQVLKTGFCDIEAVDDDTVRICRYMNGEMDALGHKTESKAKEVIVVCRK